MITIPDWLFWAEQGVILLAALVFLSSPIRRKRGKQ